VILLVCFAMAFLLPMVFNESTSRTDYMVLWKQIEAGNVERAVFQGDYVRGKWKTPPEKPTKDSPTPGTDFEVYLPLPLDHGLVDHMRKHNVQIAGKPEGGLFGANGIMLLINGLSLLAFLWFIWFMLRRNSDPFSSGMLGSFIRSPAKRVKESDHTTTFDDVAAMDQAKFELQEIVEFLKTPAKFLRLGAQIPKGVLLMGPPGTGKTLLARATAGEAGVPFFAINGSEFIQMFVGVGASRVRDMFKTAKESAPCILFIDEIDAVGRVRGAGLGGGHDEREQTLNQILSEMDGFQQTEAVIVVAATNRPDVLDPALLRPGRFDRHVTVDRPTKTGRTAILKIHSRKVPLDDDVDLDDVAAGTIGFSGAELKNLVNEAALYAARTNRDTVVASDFDAARDKILMGPKREEVLNERERLMTAYHESGHALLAWLLSDVDHVHKVTIIPRGRALGVTQLLPDEDRYNVGEARLHSQLAFMLGGRAAEKLVFDEYSAGAEDDLKRATQMARRMVTRWGMSTVIGPVAFRDSEEHPFLGKEMHESRDYSEETARIIDQEIQRFLTLADQRAVQVLTENRDKLDSMTKALVEKESLDQDEIAAIIGVAVKRGE
jgi:cell division protease FtsH